MLAANADLSQITPEEWELLLNGEKYTCQVSPWFPAVFFFWKIYFWENFFTYLFQLLVGTGDTRDVTLNVNLAGIRLLDPKNEVPFSFSSFFSFFFLTDFLLSSGTLSPGFDQSVWHWANSAVLIQPAEYDFLVFLLGRGAIFRHPQIFDPGCKPLLPFRSFFLSFLSSSSLDPSLSF